MFIYCHVRLEMFICCYPISVMFICCHVRLVMFTCCYSMSVMFICCHVKLIMSICCHMTLVNVLKHVFNEAPIVTFKKRII